MQNNTTEPKPNVAEQGFPLNACVHLYGCCARRHVCLDGVGALGEPREAGAVGLAGWAPFVAVGHGGGKLLGALGDPGGLRGGSGGHLGSSGRLWGTPGSSGGAPGRCRGLRGARRSSGALGGTPERCRGFQGPLECSNEALGALGALTGL